MTTRPADMPPADRWPHGVRSRYTSGCRCDECRRANREYQKSRDALNKAGFNNPLIDAAPVRRHLIRLSEQGVGSRAVAAESGVGRTMITNLKTGKQTRLRKRHAIKLLAVSTDALAPGSLVPAGPTWERVAFLLKDAGWTKVRIARAIGQASGTNWGLQLGRDWLTKRHETRVRELARAILTQASPRPKKQRVKAS